LRLKILKKLRTSNLNSDFTGSYKKVESQITEIMAVHYINMIFDYCVRTMIVPLLSSDPF